MYEVAGSIFHSMGESHMAIEYQQATQKEMQDRVRHKYQVSIDKLKALNFEELRFFSETMLASPSTIFTTLITWRNRNMTRSSHLSRSRKSGKR
jgi:hypothetical protein